MKIELIKNSELELKENLIILPCFENEDISFNKLDIPPQVLDIANNSIKEEKFKASKGELYYYNTVLEGKIINVLLLGMGKKSDANLKDAVKGLVSATKYASKLYQGAICIALRPLERTSYELFAKSVIRSIILSKYKFDKYKKSDNTTNEPIIKIVLKENCLNNADTLIEDAKIEAECVNYTRDLINEPANHMTPEILSQKARESAEKYGYEAEIFDEKYIEKMKMGAFLSVAKGSANPPRLIVLRYKGNPSDEKIYGLVGKGLCYDSGGYSIKPTSSMLDMKSDMGGSATVIGALNLIAQKKLKVNITAVIASCENMIAGNAYKPGDIICSMDKTHIEIGNTDAEGRLTLADAITYSIQEEKVSQIIELSTLTGAVLVALGEEITGAITKYDYLYDDLKKASKETLDEVWQLPYYEDYRKLLDSDFADINNIGGRYAGSITAGLFVTKFAKETPIIHLDIAGSAWGEKETPIRPKGGTGANVLMLYKYFENKIKDNNI